MPKPVLHGRDHRPEGADPIVGLSTELEWEDVGTGTIGGGGGGIQFDTYPQEGDWLELSTTDSNPTTGAGIRLNTGTLGVVASEDIIIDVTDYPDGQFQVTAGFVQFYGPNSTDRFVVTAGSHISLSGNAGGFSSTATGLHMQHNAGDLDIQFPLNGGDVVIKAYVGTTYKDIFKISQGGYSGGAPTYHILSGASWVADL